MIIGWSKQSILRHAKKQRTIADAKPKKQKATSIIIVRNFSKKRAAEHTAALTMFHMKHHLKAHSEAVLGASGGASKLSNIL